jgi:hypothetical protein
MLTELQGAKYTVISTIYPTLLRPMGKVDWAPKTLPQCFPTKILEYIRLMHLDQRIDKAIFISDDFIPQGYIHALQKDYPEAIIFKSFKEFERYCISTGAFYNNILLFPKVAYDAFRVLTGIGWSPDESGAILRNIHVYIENTHIIYERELDATLLIQLNDIGCIEITEFEMKTWFGDNLKLKDIANETRTA